MYVCVHVCMRICMCVHVYICACVYTCMYVCMCDAYMHVCAYMCACVYTCMCVCMCVCIYACVCMYLSMYANEYFYYVSSSHMDSGGFELRSLCLHDKCFYPLSYLSRHARKKVDNTCNATTCPKLKLLPKTVAPGSVPLQLPFL